MNLFRISFILGEHDYDKFNGRYMCFKITQNDSIVQTVKETGSSGISVTSNPLSSPLPVWFVGKVREIFSAIPKNSACLNLWQTLLWNMLLSKSEFVIVNFVAFNWIIDTNYQRGFNWPLACKKQKKIFEAFLKQRFENIHLEVFYRKVLHLLKNFIVKFLQHHLVWILS